MNRTPLLLLVTALCLTVACATAPPPPAPQNTPEPAPKQEATRDDKPSDPAKKPDSEEPVELGEGTGTNTFVVP